MKRFVATAIALVMALSLVACGSQSAPAASAPAASAPAASAPAASAPAAPEVKRDVELYASGSENVQSMYDILVEEYNKSQDTYEVHLNFFLSGTGTQGLTDTLIAAYQAGNTKQAFAVVELGGDDLSKIVSQVGVEALTKLDKSKIPNSANVSAENALAPEYCQPFRGTTVIFAYDSEKVTDVPDTWEKLEAWMQANPGKFDYNAPGTGGAGDSFARTVVYNTLPDEAFTSDDEKWIGEWDEGFAKLASLHPYMYESGGQHIYLNKNQGTLDALNQGEIWMCPNWADMVLSQRADGRVKDTIKIFQLKEKGLTGSLQTITIPSFSTNVDGAYDFINFMISPVAQELLLKHMAAIPLIDTSAMDMTGYEDLVQLDVSNFRIQSLGGLTTNFNERWDSEIAPLG